MKQVGCAPERPSRYAAIDLHFGPYYRIRSPFRFIVATLLLTLTACGSSSTTRVTSGGHAGEVGISGLAASPLVTLPVPDVDAERPPFAAISGNRALLVAYTQGDARGHLGAVGVLLPDKKMQPTDPLPVLLSAQPVGLSNGFGLAGTICEDKAVTECQHYSTVVVFLDFDGKVTATQVIPHSDTPIPEAVSMGSDVLVAANGYYLVRPQGAERFEVPGDKPSLCASWPDGLVALELIPENPAEPESGPITLQASEFANGKWAPDTTSRRVVGKDEALRTYPRCLPGGIQYGTSFWTPTTGWFTTDRQELFTMPERAAVLTAAGDVLLVSPPEPSLITPDGKSGAIPKFDGGGPVAIPPSATAFTIALDQDGKSGLVVSVPAASVETSVQFFQTH